MNCLEVHMITTFPTLPQDCHNAGAIIGQIKVVLHIKFLEDNLTSNLSNKD